MFGNFNSLIAEKSIKTKISTWLERLPITYKVFSETTLPEMLQLDSPLTVVNSLDKESFRVFSPDGRETRIALLKEDNDYDLNHIVSKSEERFFTFELGEIHLRMLRLRYFGYIVEEVKTHPDIAEVTWQIPKNGHYLKISHSLPTAYKEHYTELEGTIATMLNKNNEQTNVLELYKKYTKFFMELGGAPTFMEVSYIKKPSDSDGNVTEATISVMPGVSALRDMKIKDQFKYAKLATFGENISAENLGSHMAKNSEWGATVYLAYSKYGTNGYDVGKNSSDNCYTGGTNTQTNIYSTNYGQSTTNNPYGVYDLRGGSYEYVASYVNYGSSDSYLSIYGGTTSGDLYGSSDEQSTSTKYKTVYTASGTSESDSYNLLVTGNTTKKGDAVYETSTNYQNSTSWNNGTGNSADSYFPHVTHSFFLRGGDSRYQYTGMFSFGNNAGHSFNVYSFRLILCL